MLARMSSRELTGWEKFFQAMEDEKDRPTHDEKGQPITYWGVKDDDDEDEDE